MASFPFMFGLSRGKAWITSLLDLKILEKWNKPILHHLYPVCNSRWRLFIARVLFTYSTKSVTPFDCISELIDFQDLIKRVLGTTLSKGASIYYVINFGPILDPPTPESSRSSQVLPPPLNWTEDELIDDFSDTIQIIKIWFSIINRNIFWGLEVYSGFWGAKLCNYGKYMENWSIQKVNIVLQISPQRKLASLWNFMWWSISILWA